MTVRTARAQAAFLLLLISLLWLVAPGCSPALTGSDPPVAGDTPVDRFDLIIRGGLVVDGTGGPAREADVGIVGQRIVAVGDLSHRSAERFIDADGLIVAPGFINAHSHTYETYLADRSAASSLLQGITTEIGGQDGRSPLDVGQFFAEMSTGGCGVNQALLIGQGSLRQAVMGNARNPATPEQLTRMQDMLRTGMEAGAFGLSTGLEYVPGKYTDAKELAQLAAVMVPYSGVYASHLRNEGPRLLAAVNEAIGIGRTAGVKVEISHLKVIGPSLAGQSGAVIAAVAAARAEGLHVIADVYPYQTPDYAQNLQLSAVCGYYPPDALVIKEAADSSLCERSLAELATEAGVSPQDETKALLTTDTSIRVYARLVPDVDLAAFLAADFTVFCNDAGTKPHYAESAQYLVHPRTYGAFPRVFGVYVREKGLLTLTEAVHKATGKVADFLGLTDRGLIAPGYYADIVVFSPDTIIDRATFAAPQLPPDGIECVFVNGALAVSNGGVTPIRAGMPVLRGELPGR